MKILLLAVPGLALVPLFPFSAPEPVEAVPVAPTEQALVEEAIDEEALLQLASDAALNAYDETFLTTPCDCPVPLTPIKGDIFRIRANNCFILTLCGSGTKVIVQGPIPGAQVGQTVFLCGTFVTSICNTNYNGYTFTSSTIVSGCDACP